MLRCPNGGHPWGDRQRLDAMPQPPAGPKNQNSLPGSRKGPSTQQAAGRQFPAIRVSSACGLMGTATFQLLPQLGGHWFWGDQTRWGLRRAFRASREDPHPIKPPGGSTTHKPGAAGAPHVPRTPNPKFGQGATSLTRSGAATPRGRRRGAGRGGGQGGTVKRPPPPRGVRQQARRALPKNTC